MKKLLKSLSKKNFYLLIAFFILTFVLVLSLIYKDFLIQKSPFLINLISKKSSAKAFLEGDNLAVSFFIIDEDKDDVNKLLNDLGVDQTILQGLAANLDSTSSGIIKNYLPLQANLEILDEQVLGFANKKIILDSGDNLADLSSGLPAEKIEFGSGSGKLTAYIKNGRYNLLIEEPESLLNYATSSGKIYLSKALDGLFPILSKIVRIDLSLKDNKLSGEILLK